MTDMFTGMPFYWQGGGGGGLGGLGGNAATGQPAMSSSQINASMGWNPYASFNPFANTPGGFGGQTDYYSNLGAAFGRQTGGFNASPGYSAGNVQRGPDLPDLSQNPFAEPGGGTPPGYNPFDSSTYGMLLGGWGQPQPQAQPQASSGGGYVPPAMQSSPASPFTGFGFGGNRDFLAALMRNNASPQAPPLHSQNPAAANDFLQRYQGMSPQSQINNRFGGFQTPEWSAPGIGLGDQLRQQGPGVYQNDPFGGLTGAGG